MLKIKIRNYEHSDFCQAKRLVDSAFGQHYFDYIVTKTGIKIFVAEHKKDIIGLATVVPNLCKLDTSVVHQDYRHKGIGTKLTKHRIEYLKTEGCKKIKAYAWITPDGHCNAEKMLINLGFKAKKDIINVWRGLPCKYCPDPTSCECTARCFVKKL